nr:MAG TPA: hypothetical protein [Microviridae sp.]
MCINAEQCTRLHTYLCAKLFTSAVVSILKRQGS